MGLRSGQLADSRTTSRVAVAFDDVATAADGTGRTEYGATTTGAHGGYGVGFSGGKKTFVAAANARIIDTTTGEIIWADEARGEDAKFKLSIGGFGGGVENDERMFDKVMKPVVQQLVASIKAADL